MNSLKLMFISAIMFFVVSVGYCTEHYVIETTTGVANQTYENYYQSNENGGVFFITSDGNLTISSSTFISNSAISDRPGIAPGGGVIYNQGGILNIGDNVLFNFNITINTVGYFFGTPSAYGGVIFNGTNGKTEIGNNVIFSSNTTGGYGGAIYNADEGEFVIGDNVIFSSNSANWGGAILNKGILTVGNNAIFSSNSAFSVGGAISTFRSSLMTILDGVIFANNTAGSEGGAIWNWLGELNIGNDVIFSSNSANTGGAIYNYPYGKIDIGNNTIFNSNSANTGGAIYNLYGEMTIGNNLIFSSNTATFGGAIYNVDYSTITILDDAIFSSNSAESGGAIFNTGISTITISDDAIFINNTATSYGGAIYNDAFVNIGNNVVFSLNTADAGGAIYNIHSSIITIADNAIFVNNNATNNGGAIYNDAIINIGNNIEFSSNTANIGGAICNTGTSTMIIADNAVFTNNIAVSSGGAIANNNGGEINIGSSALFSSNSAGSGGAIHNVDYSTITILDVATFTNNIVISSGGAIFNAQGEINIGNDANFSLNTAQRGGAIFNDSGKINIANNVNFSSNTANYGGAIYNTGNSIITISDGATFANNSGHIYGGAICNDAILIIGNDVFFKSNIGCMGGAIENHSDGQLTIGDNAIFSLNNASYGGAIQNDGTVNIGDNAVFDSNTAGTYGGAFLNLEKAKIGDNAIFISNSANEQGGAICNYNHMGEIEIGNDAVFALNSSTWGAGAISNFGKAKIGDNAIFISNSSTWDGGAILNISEITIGHNANFYLNTGYYGGAIYNTGISTITISDGALFTNNVAISSGGAIYNAGILNLTADTINVEFTGNTANGISNAIYDKGGTINLTAVVADIIFNDRITSENNTSVININTSSNTLTQNGAVLLNANMSGYLGTVNFESGIIQLGDNGTLFNNFTVSNGATFDFADSAIKNYSFKNLTVSNGSANITVDADLENESMDTVSAESYDGTGTILVNKFNILTDSKINNLDITFTTSTVLKDKITTVTKASSALYDYTVLYSTDTGSFNFTKSAVNPILLEGAVSAMAGGYVTQVNVLGQAFNSIDGFISSSKLAKNKNRNLYASTANQIFESTNKIERGLWLRPYAVQETVKLENTDVDNISYGTLAGLDLTVTEDKMVSFYFGSTGSKQEYEEIKANQTGYIIGASGMLVKNNYYIALTANAGFTDVNADNDYGTDKFKIMMYSIGAKAGYDIEAGKNWIIQPNLLLMYGTIKTDEYITSQGAKVDSNSTNNIHIKPQIKAKLELENGWTPYGLVSVAFNAGDKAKTTTEGTDLESMSFNSYVEYGAGVNKTFIGTSWSGYGQVTGRNGGRSGYGLFAGVKYSF